jgi:hypothetical protein
MHFPEIKFLQTLCLLLLLAAAPLHAEDTAADTKSDTISTLYSLMQLQA